MLIILHKRHRSEPLLVKEPKWFQFSITLFLHSDVWTQFSSEIMKCRGRAGIRVKTLKSHLEGLELDLHQ